VWLVLEFVARKAGWHWQAKKEAVPSVGISFWNGKTEVPGGKNGDMWEETAI
jgi:hypothetical protein